MALGEFLKVSEPQSPRLEMENLLATRLTDRLTAKHSTAYHCLTCSEDLAYCGQFTQRALPGVTMDSAVGSDPLTWGAVTTC